MDWLVRAIATHLAWTMSNIYHKLVLKCSILFPRINWSVIKAKLICQSAKVSLCEAETKVKFWKCQSEL